MPKGVPNKRYTGEFKQMVVETMMREKLSYRESARQFEDPSNTRVSCHVYSGNFSEYMPYTMPSIQKLLIDKRKYICIISLTHHYAKAVKNIKVDKMKPTVMKREEYVMYMLRELYSMYGYTSFKMSKFEEYEYYIRNKDFLSSDRIITFNDTNGKLLALKPDVTLSIVKNSGEEVGCKQKVYYNESIYRISETTGQYKEIMQAGLECIGDLDLYDIYEVVSLAAKSLAAIHAEYILQISHQGIITDFLDRICQEQEFKKKAIQYISEKNAHDLGKLCRDYSISCGNTKILVSFTEIYGERHSVIARLESILNGAGANALSELKALCILLDRLPGNERIIFDFSVVNNMSYYNGIVFSGFIKGVSSGILSGGQYDKLMQKLNRKSGAIGFAVYLDLLEQLSSQDTDYDVDVLLVYSDNTSAEAVRKKTEQLIGEGKSVSAQRAIPEKLRYRYLVKI